MFESHGLTVYHFEVKLFKWKSVRLIRRWAWCHSATFICELHRTMHRSAAFHINFATQITIMRSCRCLHSRKLVGFCLVKHKILTFFFLMKIFISNSGPCSFILSGCECALVLFSRGSSFAWIYVTFDATLEEDIQNLSECLLELMCESFIRL